MILRSSTFKKQVETPKAVLLQIVTQRQVGAYCRQTPHTYMDFFREPSFTPLDIVEDILEQLNAMGTKHITLSGLGDCALHPDLKRILQKCQTLGMETILETTTIGLPVLLLTQAQVLRIPLWAFSLRHQTQTRMELNDSLFLNLLATLDELASRRRQKDVAVPDVELVVTVTADNVAYLADLDGILSNNRVQKLRLGYVNRTTALTELEIPPAPTAPEVQSAYTELEKICKEYKVSSNLKTFKKEGTNPKHEWNAYPCWVGYSFARISPYGEVRPCSHSRLIVGNIFETPSFETLWNSQRFLQFRTQMSTQLPLLGSYDECGACPYLAFNQKVSGMGLTHITELDLEV